MEKIEAEARQLAGREVERRMLDMLLSWDQTTEMRVRDVQFIAKHARTLALEAFDAMDRASGHADLARG